MISPNQLLHHIYYGKIPKIYRTEDARIGFPLYRFFSSLIEGGYAPLIDDMNNFQDLVDPLKCPDEFFPYLYESFGLKYFHDIDISYQRKFLSNIGEVVKRRGTISLVRYLVRILTGMECNISYLRGEYNNVSGRWLFIHLPVTSVEQTENVGTNAIVVQKFVTEHLPYYISPVLNYSLNTEILENQYYRSGVVCQTKSYNLLPR